ncbi:MAG: hypothetical protein IJS22_08985 [Lachnospiraceae bacterium]|nr:hypothetical protein [Lachnospiraceae bacterium]
MKYLIGLDIGTSSVKGVLTDEKGEIKHRAFGSFSYVSPLEGRVEMEPEHYLKVCLDTIGELAQAADGEEILGLCAASASGNLVMLGSDGRPMTNIISWQDRRVNEEARELFEDLDHDSFYRQIGWPFGYRAMPLSQLSYIKKHEPGLIGMCSMAAMSTEYLYFKLTGKWGISPSAGVTYYMIDRNTGTYIGEILERLGLRESQLPPIMPCGAVLGGVLPEIAGRCHLKAGTPVILGSFDHPAAARGAGILKEGQMLLSCGTSWVVFLPAADAEKGFAAGALVDPFLSGSGGCCGVMSSLSSLSVKIRKYMKAYIDGTGSDFTMLTELARRSRPGARGLRLDLNADPGKRVLIASHVYDIARAIMEGAVHLLKDRLDALALYGLRADKAVMAGGPSGDPFWIELIEQICGVKVTAASGAFTGAAGAAVIAGIASGVYRDEMDAAQKAAAAEGDD